MTNSALAHHFSYIGPTSKRFRTIVLPWKDVPVAGSASPVLVAGTTRRWTTVSALAASAVALHATLVWYVVHRAESTHVVRRKQELAVQILVPPPPPPPPKVIEPPKPLPPRPVRRQVLPQVKAAAPDKPQDDATPSEPLLAVAPSAPEPASPPAPPPPPEIVTAPFGRAGYLNNPPPNYPAAAARQGWQGTVLLRVRVLSSGRVDAVELQKSSGHKLLDEEAMLTVRGWQFTPSKRGDIPIDGWATVPIEFKLDT